MAGKACATYGRDAGTTVIRVMSGQTKVLYRSLRTVEPRNATNSFRRAVPYSYRFKLVTAYFYSQLPLQTGDKVGKAFPTFI